MPEKILIIDDDVDTLKLVGLMLQKQGYRIVAAGNGAQGLIQAEAENPDLILLDVMMPEMDGYEVAKRLRANPFTADTPILMFTAKTQLDDKVVGFESGADDYLTKPTHPSELSAHVKALLARSTKGRTPHEAQPEEKTAFTIGILSSRGGLGVTTVAVNLASSLHTTSKAETIMAELCPGKGTLGLDLGVTDMNGLSRLLQLKPVDITRQKVKDELFTHGSGLKVLVSSIYPNEATLLENIPQMELIINRLTHLASYLVLDLGAGLTKLNQNLVSKCDQLIVVLEPIPNTILHTKEMLSALQKLGHEAKHIQAVVVNRIRSDTQMNYAQVQEKLEHPVPIAITPAPELTYQAIRTHTITSFSQPSSLTSQQFAKLAALMLELESG